MARIDAGANRTLISSVQLNRRRGRMTYRIVLTVVVVAFTLALIGPLYFLFTGGLKSTQEAAATPPTLYPHHVYPGNYLAAWNRLDIGLMPWNTVYYAFGALAFQLVFDVAGGRCLQHLPAQAPRRSTARRG
jgi:multiple sugar transport system permease protein